MHPSTDFIEIYPDALDRETCAAIVARLRDSDGLAPGRVGGGVYPELKRSRDLRISGEPEWAENRAAPAAGGVRRHPALPAPLPQALISPLMLQIDGRTASRGDCRRRISRR